MHRPVRHTLWATLALPALLCWPAAADAQPRPQGDDFFPILSWELPPRSDNFPDPKRGLQSLADCGFTVAGFPELKHLDECKRVGLRAIVSWRGNAQENWGKLSDAEIDKTVSEVARATRDRPEVIGYFLYDEPGAKDFAGLARASAAVRKHAPGKVAYVNLFPNYAVLGATDTSQLGTATYPEYLDRFAAEVRPQVLSYDNYQVQYSHDLQNLGVAASHFTNLSQVRKAAQDHKVPFWFIGSSSQIRPDMPPPSPADLLVQAYTALAAGARGLTWYTYYAGDYLYAPVDKRGNRTATWSYLKMVNDQVKVVGPQLLKLTSTGVYLASAPKEWAAGVPPLPGKLVQSVACATPVMVGEFAGPGGQAWVMLVNLDLRQSAKPALKWVAPGGAARAVSPADGSLAPIEADQSVRLAAGQGVLLRLR